MSLLRVFDVMCWMFSWKANTAHAANKCRTNRDKRRSRVSADPARPLDAGPALARSTKTGQSSSESAAGILEAVQNEPALPQSVTISPDASV